ncbi:thioesterase [Mycolicibacterium moriokaense]|jgi:acyl-coenzyme A thioesterase PaaI-like protein|uniref:Acyl-coenzyme A thioesterase THEM4 n=1 Tax=Mycolicibacterium moriokaense TaxID=39691 RepID=A0AAD1M6Q1_9MYCO|nr:PaaI family thioesterase [Mycolicibacterium moriokaense]MCV7039827.1 PaaI family thioesterase [Mycolicibacterium moriokaense]ORB25675.1 thioesterase [Mycolicibacterium moriokaense]BBX01725.1 thioesterase [Mycolicibacterium moriokaense]
MTTAQERLAESVRRLIDVTIRTEVDDAAVAAVTEKIDSATAQLSDSLVPGSFGVRTGPDGQSIALGNVVIGLRNPVAPPLTIRHDADGTVHTEFTLGAAYEGPPGHVHGGVCALILDHVLGATAHLPGKPAVTGTLTLRYLRGTPLGRPLRASAHVDRIEGAKTFAVGHIAGPDGVTVTAEGVFIHPKGGQRDG